MMPYWGLPKIKTYQGMVEKYELIEHFVALCQYFVLFSFKNVRNTHVSLLTIVFDSRQTSNLCKTCLYAQLLKRAGAGLENCPGRIQYVCPRVKL